MDDKFSLHKIIFLTTVVGHVMLHFCGHHVKAQNHKSWPSFLDFYFFFYWLCSEKLCAMYTTGW